MKHRCQSDRLDIQPAASHQHYSPSNPTNCRQSAWATTIRTHYRQRVVDIDFIFPIPTHTPTKGRFWQEEGLDPSARLSLPPRFSYLPDTSVHTRVTVGVHWVVSWHRIDISIRCCLTSCRLPERCSSWYSLFYEKYTIVETSVVYVCNFIDFIENTDALQVAALGVTNHSKQHYVNSLKKLKVSKYMRMPHRRLVPKTVDIQSKKDILSQCVFQFFYRYCYFKAWERQDNRRVERAA